MGETEKQRLPLSCHRFWRVAFQGSRVTSDGGLLLVRELDERWGFGELILIGFRSFEWPIVADSERAAPESMRRQCQLRAIRPI